MRLTSEPCAGSVTINCGCGRCAGNFQRFPGVVRGDRGPVPAPGADPVPGAPSPIPDHLSRLPGAAYDTVCELFESHQLVKTSGHPALSTSSVPEQLFCWMR